MAVGDLMGLITHNAPEFPEGCEWPNTKKPLSIAGLSGNIIILDFWTYCCINCMHMISVLSKIEDKYRKDPVIIIGVHSAKFENENNPKNISEAIARYGIGHPVVVDRKMQIWNRFGVSAWPTLVIIGPTGRIEYKTAGEMNFEQLDQLISGILQDARKSGSLSRQRADISVKQQERKGTLSYPGKISFSEKGSEFALSDSNHNRILVINAKSGKILHTIGSGKRGLTDGAFGEASFFRPQGVLWHKDTIYVADTENHAIRRISLSDKRVETIAGDGSAGQYGRHGSSYPALSTQLNSPWDLATDGKRLFIAMAGLHQIWEYSIRDALISPFAGSGSENISDGSLDSAEFAQPSGLWLDGDNLYVADSEVSGIRSISLREEFVSTIIGKGLFVFGDRTGSLSDTLLQHPIGISGKGGTLYIADTYNGSIKAVDINKKSTYSIISGKGKESVCRVDDPACDTLGLFEPNDVKIFGNKLYIADTDNHLVRYFDLKDRLLKTLEIG